MKASKKTKSPSNPVVVKGRYNLPSHDALAQILQETPAERLQAIKPKLNHTYQAHPPRKRPPLHGYEEDSYVADITDLQTKVECHSAVSKMAEDMIALRTRVVMLEAENRQLRRELSVQDLGQDLLDDTNIDVMTKAEIADRIGKRREYST